MLQLRGRRPSRSGNVYRRFLHFPSLVSPLFRRQFFDHALLSERLKQASNRRKPLFLYLILCSIFVKFNIQCIGKVIQALLHHSNWHILKIKWNCLHVLITCV